MYKSIYYDNKNEEIHVWDDEKGYFTFGHEPYAYLVDSSGEFKSMDGHSCKKVNRWSDESVKLGLVYEHDVPATTRALIDLYPDSDELSTNCKVLFVDIEVEKGEKYSTPDVAANVITAITYHVTGDELYTCLLLDRKKGKQKLYKDIVIKSVTGQEFTAKAKILTFSTEFDLLRFFIGQYQNFGHSIITGWNVEYFDVPYSFNRIVNVLGWSSAQMLSPIKIVKRNFDNGQGQTISIAGISVLDYIMLYKKFTYSEQPNYKLDTIAKIELGLGKLEFEGDLDTLYRNDIMTYAEYNIRDVMIVNLLDKKLDFIDIARGLCHKGHVPYQSIIHTSAYIDGALLTFCRRKNLIASSNKSTVDEGQAAGAYVKLPIPGVYKWVYDLDLTSLYPMNIITINISPETKYGKILEWDEEEFVKGTTRKYTIKLIKDNSSVGQFDEVFVFTNKPNTVILNGSTELLKYVKDNNLSISSNGILYTLSKQGIIPEILSIWFDERDKFKNLRKDFEKKNDTVQASYFDKKQLVTKYLLNSVYGVLLLNTFRFYDKDNGEAVTTTGVKVIQWSGKMANFYYNKLIGSTNEDYVIYTDTDSTFLPLLPLIEHHKGDVSEWTDEEICKYGLTLIDDVQGFINRSYQKYGEKFHNVQKHRWNIKQELISRRSFWVGVKKRYAQWLVNKEGHPVTKDNLDVKGMDVVRSSFPKLFRAFMKEILTDILHDAESNTLNDKVRVFKKKIDTADLLDILLPVGVKEISKYKTENGVIPTGCPIHVKSAINHNRLMQLKGITNATGVNDGDKILWGYLKPNQYGFDTIGIKANNEIPEMEEFILANVDRNLIFDKALKKKLQQYWDVLGWGEIELNTLSKKFFDFN